MILCCALLSGGRWTTFCCRNPQVIENNIILIMHNLWRQANRKNVVGKALVVPYVPKIVPKCAPKCATFLPQHWPEQDQKKNKKRYQPGMEPGTLASESSTVTSRQRMLKNTHTLHYVLSPRWLLECAKFGTTVFAKNSSGFAPIIGPSKKCHFCPEKSANPTTRVTRKRPKTLKPVYWQTLN